MKATFEVASRREAEEIRRGLDDPTVRAFVRVIGTLNTLPNDRARKRVINYIADMTSDVTRSVSAEAAGDGA